MIIFIYLVAIYLLVVFVGSRLVIPHLGFSEEKIPAEIPAEMLEKINQLKSQAKDQKEFLNLAYDYLGAKFRTGRFQTITKFNYLFKPVEQAWRLDGFMPCTTSNYILKIFLVKSGFFKDSEIRRRQVFFNFMLHQYLQVKLEDRWLDVDVGEKQRGLTLGKHLKYFG